MTPPFIRHSVFLMSRFQTFDESTSPAQGPERIGKLRAELASVEGSTASSCLGQTSIRANTYQKAPSDWLGSRALQGRPAPP